VAVLKAIGCTGVEKLPPFGSRIFLSPARTDDFAHRFTGDLGYEAWIDIARARLVGRLVRQGRDPRHPADGTHASKSAYRAGFLQAHVDSCPRTRPSSSIGRARRSSSISGGWSISTSRISTAVAPC